MRGAQRFTKVYVIAIGRMGSASIRMLCKLGRSPSELARQVQNNNLTYRSFRVAPDLRSVQNTRKNVKVLYLLEYHYRLILIDTY